MQLISEVQQLRCYTVAHSEFLISRFLLQLKILPSSSATWCIMVNVSMWCLPTTVHEEWCARYYYRNNKES